VTLTQAITVVSDADGRLEPRVAGGNVCVAAVVDACHEMTIDAGLAHLDIPGLDRTTLEPVLTYCAQELCIADEASCPGCRRRMEREGIGSFDDFVARHREIVIADGEVRVTGNGERTLHTESLKTLAARKSKARHLLMRASRRR